jgi:hypothetical protein
VDGASGSPAKARVLAVKLSQFKLDLIQSNNPWSLARRRGQHCLRGRLCSFLFSLLICAL